LGEDDGISAAAANVDDCDNDDIGNYNNSMWQSPS
jgi:hypothetical protein